MDRRLAALLQEKFGDRLLTPVRQRYDESEIRVALADATDTLRTLHDDPAFRFEMLIDLCGVDTGEEMQVVASSLYCYNFDICLSQSPMRVDPSEITPICIP